MIEMLRRQKTVWQALLLFVIVGLTIRSAHNYYNDNESKLRSAKIRHHELLEERNSLTRQVDGRWHFFASCESLVLNNFTCAYQFYGRYIALSLLPQRRQ